MNVDYSQESGWQNDICDQTYLKFIKKWHMSDKATARHKLKDYLYRNLNKDRLEEI